MQTSAFARYPVAVPYSYEIVRENRENVKKKSQGVGGNYRFHACDFFVVDLAVFLLPGDGVQTVSGLPLCLIQPALRRHVVLISNAPARGTQPIS